ncbi:probable multidrug resistance-associated protein lethal(2)03659, partial [Contarinia nasturtii]|uniref:probable multidrug resistance-associated protein lethal(2)03659 n=1 Tax=Contarinia nasturtii TaxID=265458 RepID=UPI0012D3C3C2
MESAHRKLLKNPRKSASWMSVLFFGWTIPLFKQSYQRDALHPNDVFEPLEEDQSDRLGDRLETNWKSELKLQSCPLLLRSMFKTFWHELLLLGVLYFFQHCVCRPIYPFLLKGFLSYFRDNSEVSFHEARNYGVGLFILSICTGIITFQYIYYRYYSGMKVRVAISSVIYRKALRLSQSALSKTSSAKLVNLLSNDVQRFECISQNELWVPPAASMVATYILWNEIGWA